MLDASYEAALHSGKWEQCEMPNVPEFGWWVKGIPSSSYTREDGSWCTWRWKQPKTENYVYCITTIRQPVENSTNGEWETVETVGRKPLVLTEAAELFFANFNQPQ